jgi:glycerate 2-kinase
VASLPPERFSTYSIRQSNWADAIRRILSAALRAVDPAEAIARFMYRDDNALIIADRSYDLTQFTRVRLIGIGKAAAPMAAFAVNVLGDRLDGGIVVTKPGYIGEVSLPSKIHIIESGHPIPNESSLQAANQIEQMLKGSDPKDFLICLVSGGGSALLTAPAPGIELDGLKTLTGALLACGADIHEINTLRRHLDRLKGGGLARLAAPACIASLILSDVLGDALEMIASGPTASDPTTFSDAIHILERYHLTESIPPSVLEHLIQGATGGFPETLKPGDPLMERIQNVIIGSNHLAAQAALNQAREEGLNALLLTASLRGEARQAGGFLASITRQISQTGQPLSRPACVVAGGETTVTILGDGLGGRNQELALGAVSELAGLPDVALVTLATDGGDGPTDAAGAVITGETLKRAHQAGLDPQDFLQRNDSYHFFSRLDDLLKPGPTLTNVNDLALVFAF